MVPPCRRAADRVPRRLQVWSCRERSPAPAALRSLRVNLFGVETPYVESAEVNRAGEFRFRSLAPGNYTVAVVRKGLGEVRRTVVVSPAVADPVRSGARHHSLHLGRSGRQPHRRRGFGSPAFDSGKRLRQVRRCAKAAGRARSGGRGPHSGGGCRHRAPILRRLERARRHRLSDRRRRSRRNPVPQSSRRRSRRFRAPGEPRRSAVEERNDSRRTRCRSTSAPYRTGRRMPWPMPSSG